MYCESLFTSSIDFPAKNVYRNVYIKKKKRFEGFLSTYAEHSPRGKYTDGSQCQWIFRQ